jgi:DNA-binding beta-propeller fold protein YncE
MRFPLALTMLWVLAASPAFAVVFESAHVHPIEISPDGSKLFAVNTDEQRVSVFSLTQGPLPVLIAEIPVGLEPVTVRARGTNEIWVVNAISGSVSIVDLTTLNVKRTLLVGPRPTDVVFAGTPAKAFVSVAQDDAVRVYDAASPGAPESEIFLSGSEPRSLAVSKNGDRVYVTLLDSGNKTTIVPEAVVTSSLHLPPPNPPMKNGLPAAPNTGLIVRYNGTFWADEQNRNWNFALPYTLLDQDVMAIGVVSRQVEATFGGVGTTLMNVAVNPVSGMLYVSNQEASNEVRFEPNLSGKFVKTRLTVINPGTNTVTAQLLNGHINYSDPAGTSAERLLSLAFPLDVLVSPDGNTVFVAAFGSSKVGRLNGSGVLQSRIDVGRGPSGLALDAAGRLFVLDRFDGTIGIVNAGGASLAGTVPLGFDATPSDVRNGRALFYNARDASAHGDISCASCHVFAGTDNMSWDLGNPLGDFQPAPPNQPGSAGFHPMKGPMLTQSLKGISTTEPFHWRGDRADLAAFNPAFVSLLGRGSQLSASDMQLFQTFLFDVAYPQNPFRPIDDSLPATLAGGNPVHGQQLFTTGNLDGGSIQCVQCHTLPTGENGLIIPASALREPQDMKVPQLRNLWEKTRFQTTGASVRGFGYTHDGSIKDLFTFLQFPGFTFANDNDRRDVASFLLLFDTGTMPAVGAQWTMDGTNQSAGLSRVNTLVSQADLGNVGLIAKGRDGFGAARGWSYTGAGNWVSDRKVDGTQHLDDLLRIAAAGHEVTFTAVLTGSQDRLGVDRDQDGFRDRDELDAGSNPADPLSVPSSTGVGDAEPVASRLLGHASPNPAAAFGTRIAYDVPRSGPVRLAVFDLSGREIAVLVDAPSHAAGHFDASWDLRDVRGARVSSGIYFVRYHSVSGNSAERVVVLR